MTPSVTDLPWMHKSERERASERENVYLTAYVLPCTPHVR